MLSDPFFLLCASSAVIVAGLSKGGFGGGAAFASTPILALAVGPAAAAGIMLPILCFIDLFSIYAFRWQWDWRNLRALGASCVIGVALGAMTFQYANPAALKLLMGSIALGFLAYSLIKPRLEAAPFSALKAGFWGVLAGYTSFAAHAGGPPVAMQLLSQKLDRTTYQATNAAFFGWVNLVKIFPYYGLGLFGGGNIKLSLAFLPLALISVALGVWAHHRLNDGLFYALIYFFLGVVGLKLCHDGIMGLI